MPYAATLLFLRRCYLLGANIQYILLTGRSGYQMVSWVTKALIGPARLFRKAKACWRGKWLPKYITSR